MNSSAYWDMIGNRIRDERMGKKMDNMVYGDGWYLFRCGKCKQAFIATSMAEWCDCGNTQFDNALHYPKGIKVESDLKGADGCIIVWDHRPVWVDRLVIWLRNRTTIKWLARFGV